MTTTTQSMTARTMSMTMIDATHQNPVRAAVASIRGAQNDLTPRQQEIRDAGRRRVDALIASGQYSLARRD